jgi:hypothetical protein
MAMDDPFDFEFTTDLTNVDDALIDETERELRALAEGHTDLIGAAVALNEVSKDETPHAYRARIVAYIRPSNLAAVEQADSPEGAMQGALRAVRRQIRERRGALGKPWKRP